MRTIVAVIVLLLAGCGTTNTSDIGYSRGTMLQNGMFVATNVEDHDALPLSAPEPQCPAAVKAKGVHGKVQAEITITEQGTVPFVTILQSPDSDLSAAVVETLKTWTFFPAVRHQRIMRETRRVEFQF